MYKHLSHLKPFRIVYNHLDTFKISWNHIYIPYCVPDKVGAFFLCSPGVTLTVSQEIKGYGSGVRTASPLFCPYMYGIHEARGRGNMGHIRLIFGVTVRGIPGEPGGTYAIRSGTEEGGTPGVLPPWPPYYNGP